MEKNHTDMEREKMTTETKNGKKTIKVWLENRLDQEREADAEELAKAFYEWKKETGAYGILERIVAEFLSQYTIEGKRFVWDNEGLEAVIDAYLIYTGVPEEVRAW